MTEKLRSPFWLKLFLLSKLPLALLAGIRLEHIGDDQCSVSIPFRWINKNPFRSMYFAAQSMAAEFSTAALAVMYIERSGERVSMLLTGMKADFFKKATTRVQFTCRNGAQFREAFDQHLSGESGFEVQAVAEGIDAAGDLVSKFYLTWSFKRRIPKA